MNDSQAIDHRKLPRRRGDALNAAIYQAALAELAEKGFAALTMESVAERARASKASLYRRWSSRVELLMDAVYNSLPNPETTADTGNLRDDLLTTVRGIAAELSGPVGEAFKAMLVDVLSDPARAAEVRERARGNGVQLMREIGMRAASRGEIDPAVLTPRRLESGQAVLRYHFIFHGTPIPDEVIVSIVDDVVLPLFHAPAR